MSFSREELVDAARRYLEIFDDSGVPREAAAAMLAYWIEGLIAIERREACEEAVHSLLQNG